MCLQKFTKCFQGNHTHMVEPSKRHLIKQSVILYNCIRKSMQINQIKKIKGNLKLTFISSTAIKILQLTCLFFSLCCDTQSLFLSGKLLTELFTGLQLPLSEFSRSSEPCTDHRSPSAWLFCADHLTWPPCFS